MAACLRSSTRWTRYAASAVDAGRRGRALTLPRAHPRQIRVIDRKQEVPHDGAMCDLMWSDPEGARSAALRGLSRAVAVALTARGLLHRRD